MLSAAALAGGFAGAAALGLAPPGLRFGAIVEAVGAGGAAVAVGKAAGFGAIVAASSCFFGLRVGPSLAEVPRAAARGAGAAFVLCLALDGAISIAPLLG